MHIYIERDLHNHNNDTNNDYNSIMMYSVFAANVYVYVYIYIYI